MKAIHEQNLAYTVKTDDHVPYADFVDYNWSGFYTSKPNLKKYIRDGLALFQASSKVFTPKLLDSSLDQTQRTTITQAMETLMDAQGVA